MRDSRVDHIHVVVDATPIAMGGGLVVLLNYLRHWRCAHPEAKFSVLAWRAEVLEAIGKIEGIRVIPFGVGSKRLAVYAGRLFRLSRIVHQLNPDVVLTHNSLIWGCKAPQVVLHQGQWPLIHIKFWLWARRVGLKEALMMWARHRTVIKALRQAECNVFISRSLREQARCLEPDSLLRNYVVYNGMRRPSNFEELAQTQPDRPREPLLLALQHSLAKVAYPYKESATLLATLAKCRQLRPDIPWRLKIVGRGGLAYERKLAEQLCLMDAVEFIDYYDVSNLYVQIQRALCLVFPSVMEGFGLPPLEAMANGTPVIVADSSAMPEVVGDAGIIVRACDAEAFARAIIMLHEDPQARSRYIRAGFERVKRFDWGESARQLFDLLVSHSRKTARQS